MSTDAILVNEIGKLFPVVRSGLGAYLAPFSRPINPALSGVSFRVAAGAGSVGGRLRVFR